MSSRILRRQWVRFVEKKIRFPLRLRRMLFEWRFVFAVLLASASTLSATCPSPTGGFAESCENCGTSANCILRCECHHNNGGDLRPAACNVQKCADAHGGVASIGNTDGVLFCHGQRCEHPPIPGAPTPRVGCPVPHGSYTPACEVRQYIFFYVCEQRGGR